MKIRLILTLASVFGAGGALAVEYSLPDDGWYQLQNADSYEELCSSASTSCDVPPGQYILINHSVPSDEPGHREIITVASTDPVNTNYAIESTIVTTECTFGYPGRPNAQDGMPCVAQCPDSYALTGGSCRATRFDTYFDFGANGTFSREVKLRVPTLDTPTPTSFSCEIDTVYDYNPNMDFTNANNFTKTPMTATAICATVVSQ